MPTVQVQPGACQGHGRCYTLAADLFAPDEEGFAVVIKADLDAAEVAVARDAARNCPEGAIWVEAGEPS